MSGIKYDKDKPKVALLDPQFVLDLSAVGTMGAEKYGDYNWQQGMAWSRMFSAMQRHSWQFWDGEDNDQESELSHLLHVAYNAMMLYHCVRNRPDLDDRSKANGTHQVQD